MSLPRYRLLIGRREAVRPVQPGGRVLRLSERERIQRIGREKLSATAYPSRFSKAHERSKGVRRAERRGLWLPPASRRNVFERSGKADGRPGKETARPGEAKGTPGEAKGTPGEARSVHHSRLFSDLHQMWRCGFGGCAFQKFFIDPVRSIKVNNQHLSAVLPFVRNTKGCHEAIAARGRGGRQGSGQGRSPERVS